MTIGQFFLGIVTLLVATLVYRWQKALDRQTAQKNELGRLYAEYVSALAKHINSQPMIGDVDAEQKAQQFRAISETETQVYVLRDQIALLAPENVVDALRECDDSFRTWKIRFNSEYEDYELGKATVNEAFADLSNKIALLNQKMREDLQAHSRVEFWSFRKLFANRK